MNRLQRFVHYQQERFPLGVYLVLVAALSAAGVTYSATLRDLTIGPPVVQGLAQLLAPRWLVAAYLALAAFFQLRVLDEFKDYADDLAHRPYRPVPRGLITLGELAGAAFMTAVLQAVLAWWIAPRLLLLLGLVWLYLGLMRFEFFAPVWLKAQPLLYLFLHGLITPLIVLLITACDWLAARATLPAGLGWFLALSLANGLVFELGRKIRTPHEEESGVETYSALWGRANAVVAWLVALAVAVLCLVVVARPLAWAGRWAGAVIGLLWLGAAGVSSQFLRQPAKASGKRIEQMSALWVLLLYLGLAVSALWRMVGTP